MYFKSCQCDVLKRSTAAIYGHSVYICTCLGRWFSKFYTQQSILCNHFICTIDDILLLLLSRLFKITATLILFWHRALNQKRYHSSLFITVILQKRMSWCDQVLRVTKRWCTARFERQIFEYHDHQLTLYFLMTRALLYHITWFYSF